MKLINYLKEKSRLVILGSTLILVIAIVAFLKLQRSSNIYVVKRDYFESVITCKGEMQSERAVLINFPDILGDRNLSIYQLQIKDLVPEGTIVKKGEYVALLDEGRIKQLTQQNTEALQKATAAFNDSKLDSAVTLSTSRDDLEQLEFDLKYKKIDVEQSVYDSPANQRMTQISYDRTARLLDSKRRSYRMQQNEFRIRCSRKERQYLEYKAMDEKYQQSLVAIRITAPSDGMVIYARKWGGRKTKIDDYVNLWDPAIATLPDLKSLVSETYAEEIYISKIHVGDSVRVRIDALKNKEILGSVAKISNIGQDMTGYDSNVFKLYIRLAGDISKLKPSMTTSNEIILGRKANVLVIPLQCLFTETGSQYVYLSESGKITKKRVVTGEKNDKVIIIKSGLREKDRILTSEPEKQKI